ncbi:MAG: FKBP-type peptidyl-prolyl cis-trans isomerase [Cryobacterium sp.]|nr:FKBP-type peptidyl-prolyl cis-trans isomerase [Oligoflexia bacterium]
MKTQVVSFHCVLKNKLGKVLGSTFNHEVIACSEGEGAMLQGLVDGMQGLRKGEKRSIFVPAEKAYGFYDPRLSFELARRDLPEGKIEVGNEVVYPGPDGEERHYRVTKVGDRTVTLEGNHALAGEDLIFDIEATEAREATPSDVGDELFSEKHGFLH